MYRWIRQGLATVGYIIGYTEGLAMEDTFVLYADGSIDSFEGDDEWSYEEPGLYDDLVLAGYPLEIADYALEATVIDVCVHPETFEVTAHYDGGRESTPMGAAGELFASWYRSTRAA